MLDMKQFTIAVDFDGTCVEERFPHVGPDIFGAEMALKKLVFDGHKLLLWTCREHNSYKDVPDTLQLAIDWFDKKGIPLYGINENPDMNALDYPRSRKCHADFVIDDHSICIPRCTNGDLNWYAIYQAIRLASIDNK